MALAVALFAVALLVIATERVDRTKVALAGGVLMLLTQTIEQDQAIEAIDWNTLGLLAGMMLMVKVTEPTGVYTWLAIRAGQLSRGRPVAVMWSLAVTTAVLSAFLGNLTTVLLMVPITFLGRRARHRPDPAGRDRDPGLQHRRHGDADRGPAEHPHRRGQGLSFTAFITNLAPVAIVTFAVVTTGLYMVYRRQLRVAPEARQRVMELDARRSIEDMGELKRTVPVLVGTILLFFAHQALHLEPATVALTGATVMLFVSRQNLADSLAGIEWPTLFFFIGLS